MSVAEIVAPAGSRSALEAAVLCGADAVYLGSAHFNARRNAQNFGQEELADAVQYCHNAGVKVYLALNTLVFEEERAELIQTLRDACECGIDAVIVQDLGVAALVKECAPELRLHASTQMAIHNPEGAKLLEQLGFSRVVLARELTKREIAAIAQSTSLEIEMFVHGALCMSVSGQCYLSSVLGERSGNRGLCAQPCRLPFACGSQEFALSLKDLSLVDQIQECVSLGVHSLKIEGRMKRPEYVAAAVTACRAALVGEKVDSTQLQAVFSRSGFTDGYYFNAIDAGMFGHRQKEDVTAASADVFRELSSLYTDAKKHIHKVGLDVRFTMRTDHPARLCVTDADGYTATAVSDPPQIAQNKPTEARMIEQSLSKTGGTPFFIRKLDVELDEGLMLPVSSLNKMRREALESIVAQRTAIHPVSFVKPPVPVVTAKDPVTAKRTPVLRIRLNRLYQLSEPLLESCTLLSLPLSEMVQGVRDGRVHPDDRIAAELPRMMFDCSEQVREQLVFLQQAGLRHVTAGNMGSVELARSMGFDIHGTTFLNIANSMAVQTWEKLGLTDTTVSFELSLNAARKLRAAKPVGLVGYGHLPLMTMRNCPVKANIGCKKCSNQFLTLTDRKGTRFPIDCASGASELLNAVPLVLSDRLDELYGFDFLWLYFTSEDADACRRVVRQYQIGANAPKLYTRGLYYRSVK